MRSLGALNMSVGTSLAFELGSDSLRGTDSYLFNLRTVFRNVYQSYEKDDQERKDKKELAKNVKEDLGQIAAWVESFRANKEVKLIVYYPSYSNITMKLKYPYANLWEPSTEQQKAYEKICNDVCDMVASDYSKLIVKTGIGMPSFTGRGVVLTHHVIDLAECGSHTRLSLLESHTGTVKPFTLWHTKLTGGDQLHNMPFNRLTVQIFGDRSTNFKSSNQKTKELVKNLAEKAEWTSASTLSRVRGTISSLADGIDKAVLLKMI